MSVEFMGWRGANGTKGLSTGSWGPVGVELGATVKLRVGVWVVGVWVVGVVVGAMEGTGVVGAAVGSEVVGTAVVGAMVGAGVVGAWVGSSVVGAVVGAVVVGAVGEAVVGAEESETLSDNMVRLHSRRRSISLEVNSQEKKGPFQ